MHRDEFTLVHCTKSLLRYKSIIYTTSPKTLLPASYLPTDRVATVLPGDPSELLSVTPAIHTAIEISAVFYYLYLEPY